MLFQGELFLAWRYLKPQKSLLSLLTYISILGPLLGVAVLIVVMSVMNGMPRSFIEALKEYNPHLTLEAPQVIIFADDLVEYIEKKYNVHASPVTSLKVFMQKNRTIQPRLCKGIDLSKSPHYKKMLTMADGSQPTVEKLRPNEILLSTNTALSGSYRVGDKIILHSPSRYKEAITSQVNGQVKRVNMNSAKEFTIVGFYNVKYRKIDEEYLLIHQDSANEMLAMDWGAAKSIELTLKDPMMATKLAAQMKADPKLKDFTFIPWENKSDGIFLRIKQEKLQMSFVLFLIMGAAGIGIGACIFSLVVQKTKEIGILKSIGVSAYSIITIFLSQGLFIGVLGSSLGFLTGITILEYRSNIAALLGQWYDGLRSLQSVPMHLDTGDVNLILWGAVGICLVAALVPAIIAANVNPVKALQSRN